MLPGHASREQEVLAEERSKRSKKVLEAKGLVENAQLTGRDFFLDLRRRFSRDEQRRDLVNALDMPELIVQLHPGHCGQVIVQKKYNRRLVAESMRLLQH